jgi:hypothetical protein
VDKGATIQIGVLWARGHKQEGPTPGRPSSLAPGAAAQAFWFR